MKHKGVEGGTISGTPLCRTCRHATYAQGAAISQRYLHCNEVGELMRFEACECSAYDDKRMPSKEEMERTAWILRSDAEKKIIGFVSPKEWRRLRYKENEE